MKTTCNIWKKTIALLLCSSMLCSLATGCGKNENLKPESTAVNSGDDSASITTSESEDGQLDDGSLLVENDESLVAFEEGWNLARDYMSLTNSLKSGSDPSSMNRGNYISM